MNLILKGFYLGSISLLAACGGGSDSNSEPNSQTPITEPPIKTGYLVKANPVDSSVMGMAIAESFIQLGSLADNIIHSTSFIDNGNDKSCTNGGIYTQTILDKDNNNILSNSDEVSVEYRDCYIDTLDTTLNGIALVRINTTNLGNSTTIGEIDLSDVVFDGDNELTFQGVIQFENTSLAMSNQIMVKNLGAVSLIANNDLTQKINFSNVSFTRLEQYSDATYALTGIGTIEISSADVKFAFKITDAIKGYFGEFPHKGSAKVYTSSTDFVDISSNFVVNSSSFNVSAGSDSYLVNWREAVEGSLWQHSGSSNQGNTSTFRSDNFEFVGMLDAGKLNNFPVSGGSVRALMSRPVKPGIHEAYFETSEWPYSRIPATITIDGAIVNITPQFPLNAGQTYRISSFQVLSLQESANWVHSSSNVRVNDALILKYNYGIGLYKEGDYPELDASESKMNDGNSLSFKWVDVNNIGITFTDDDAANTSFSAPSGYKKDITLRLVLNNAAGYEISSDFKISYFVPNSTMMRFVSPLGDYIGGGQVLSMDTSNAVFTVSQNKWTNQDHIGVKVDGNTWWTLDIAAPQGKTLEVKRYENATRYPFQAPLNAGLDFSGDHRGCNKSIGDFEVLELVYGADESVEKLAINFEQSCELSMPRLKGIIRFNSNAKLN